MIRGGEESFGGHKGTSQCGYGCVAGESAPFPEGEEKQIVETELDKFL